MNTLLVDLMFTCQHPLDKSILVKYLPFAIFTNKPSGFPIGLASKTMMLFSILKSKQNLYEPSCFFTRTKVKKSGELDDGRGMDTMLKAISPNLLGWGIITLHFIYLSSTGTGTSVSSFLSSLFVSLFSVSTCCSPA